LRWCSGEYRPPDLLCHLAITPIHELPQGIDLTNRSVGSCTAMLGIAQQVAMDHAIPLAVSRYD
jgi:hypothetical protein